MNINLIRLSNSLDPNANFKKADDDFINEINNELFEEDLELVEGDKEAKATVLFIETGGSEQYFVKIEKELPRPIILISTCKNNSLPACFEIKSYLLKQNEDCFLLFGSEKEIAYGIIDTVKLFTAQREIDGASLGVIGKPSDWLIASTVDYQKVKEKFNINLVDISTNELKEEINKGILDNIPKLANVKKLGKDNKYLEGALLIYSGIKRIVKKYNLKGFTIRCFDLIEEYKNTACLALAMLNEEGIVGTCEGDIPSMLTMFIIKAGTGKASFQANPSKIDLKTESALFAHCTVPLNMVKNTKFMTHFESGLGIGIRGDLDLGEVTICKIFPDLRKILFIKGELDKNETFTDYCRTQINVKISDPEDLYHLISGGYGNHVIIVYGNVIPEFYNLMKFYNQTNEEDK